MRSRFSLGMTVATIAATVWTGWFHLSDFFMSGYAINSLQDYMGLPTVGQVAGGATVSHAAFHLRAYNLIWNDWLS